MLKEVMREQLYGASTLEFAIEGKFTNLQVWVSHAGPGKFRKGMIPELVYMRINIANQSSVPFTHKNASVVLEYANPTIDKLLELVDFTAPINSVDSILDILITMKPRIGVAW